MIGTQPLVLYKVRHIGCCSLTDSTAQEGKMLQTEAQLSAILWLDREKQRQLIATAEEGFKSEVAWLLTSL